MEKICVTCRKNFKTNSNRKKFCCKECYYSYKKPPKSESTRKLLSLVNLEYYKNTPLEIKQKRWDKISNSHRKKVPDNILIDIKELLQRKYIRDINILISKIDYPLSITSFKNILKANPDLYQLWKETYKFIPTKVQNWEKDKFINFINDCKYKSYSFLQNKYELGEKSIYTLIKKLNVEIFEGGKKSKKETSIEYIVRKILEEENVHFLREKYLNNMKFRVDFLIDNKVIEVLGDYFHANPLIFDYENLHRLQKENLIRDAEKRAWLPKNGYELMEVWENELYTNFEETKEKILNYVRNNN